MAVANKTIVIDNKVYHAGETYPDLGSLVGSQNDDGTRSYSGSYADVSKLPIYPDLKAGSDAALSDAAGLHVLHFNGTQWNEC